MFGAAEGVIAGTYGVVRLDEWVVDGHNVDIVVLNTMMLSDGELRSAKV